MRILIILLLFTQVTFAQEILQTNEIKKRWVDLTWEHVEGAQSYELKLYRLMEGESSLYREYKKRDPEWSDELEPGQYILKMRGVDKRGVSANWGDDLPFDVNLPDPVLIYPYENDEINAIEMEIEKVPFKWRKIPGTVNYAFQIWSKVLKDFDKTFYVEENGIDLLLETSYEYFWKVTPLTKKNAKVGKQEEGRSLLLVGGRMNPPTIKIKEKNNQIHLSWNKPKHANHFTIKVFKKGLNDRWVNHEIVKKTEKLNHTLKELPKDGTYRFAINAKAKNRQDSPYTFVEFELEENKIKDHFIKIQESADMTADSPFFYKAGMDMYQLDYNGENLENDSKIETTLTGMNFFGEVYYQEFYSHWKYRLMADIGRLSNADENITLFEINALAGRRFTNWKYPFEVYGGLFLKSDLFILGKYFTDEVEFETVQTAGPVFKVSMWHRFDRRTDVGGKYSLKKSLIHT